MWVGARGPVVFCILRDSIFYIFQCVTANGYIERKYTVADKPLESSESESGGSPWRFWRQSADGKFV